MLTIICKQMNIFRQTVLGISKTNKIYICFVIFVVFYVILIYFLKHLVGEGWEILTFAYKLLLKIWFCEVEYLKKSSSVFKHKTSIIKHRLKHTQT